MSSMAALFSASVRSAAQLCRAYDMDPWELVAGLLPLWLSVLS
jgi:hypothetical protein